MSNRIQELDALRVLAMFFVITYHFGCEYAAAGLPFINLFCTTSNYDFGNIAVTIFIALSGGLLYKRYGVIGCEERYPTQPSITIDVPKNTNKFEQIKTFYVKRAKAIYPPFWILSLYIPLSMIRHLLADGNPFFMGSPFKLSLTVIGFDGYVKLFGISTYAFCGDWFVGAIVMLYLLYPLLAKCYRKAPIVTLVTLAILYVSQFLFPIKYDELFSALPITLIFKFCMGFALIENLDCLRNRRVAIAAGAIFLAITIVTIPGSRHMDYAGVIAAFALFAVVFYIAPRLLRHKAVKLPIQKLAALSYCVFLVQHVGIVWAQAAFIKIFEKMHWSFTQWNVLALFACTLVIIVLVAWILKLASDKLVQKR